MPSIAAAISARSLGLGRMGGVWHGPADCSNKQLFKEWGRVVFGTEVDVRWVARPSGVAAEGGQATGWWVVALGGVVVAEGGGIRMIALRPEVGA